MPSDNDLILGEAPRSLDERFRLSIPSEMADVLGAADGQCILAKERPGCLSLWTVTGWQAKLDEGVELVKSKMRSGRLAQRIDEVQLLGRLLSTRHKNVQLAGRGRLVLPEGFREFLGVEAGGDVMVIGAAVCIEIWNPQKWLAYLEERIPEFRQLFDKLAG